MIRLCAITAFIIFLSGSLFAQELRKVENNAFKRGEFLKYKVYYHSLLTGNVKAGEATMEVTKEKKTISGRQTYHVIGKGKSKGAFNLFFKVNDRFETYIDDVAMLPWIFIRRTREGGYVKDDDVVFNQIKNTAKSRTTERVVPPNIQDILSAFFYARTVDYSDAAVGDVFDIPFFLDDSVYNATMIYMGKEEIEIDMGKFNAIKFKPKVATGEVFDEEYPMTLWVSDDENLLPLIAESEVIVGSVRIELIEYAGLANHLKAKLK